MTNHCSYKPADPVFHIYLIRLYKWRRTLSGAHFLSENSKWYGQIVAFSCQ